jgi:hypothetical protein
MRFANMNGRWLERRRGCGGTVKRFLRRGNRFGDEKAWRRPNDCHARAAGIVARPVQPHIGGVPAFEDRPMIYILAVLLPPLGLLLNGQPFSAILNLILIVPCIIFGLVFPALFVVPSLHAVLAIAMKREDRKHREVVNAIERHGPPPGWRP